MICVNYCPECGEVSLIDRNDDSALAAAYANNSLLVITTRDYKKLKKEILKNG